MRLLDFSSFFNATVPQPHALSALWVSENLNQLQNHILSSTPATENQFYFHSLVAYFSLPAPRVAFICFITVAPLCVCCVVVVVSSFGTCGVVINIENVSASVLLLLLLLHAVDESHRDKLKRGNCGP